MRRKTSILLAVGLLALALSALAQQRGAQNAPAPAPKRATLVFRETFKGPTPGVPASRALTAADTDNSGVEMKLYGPGANAKPDHESGLLLNQADDEAKPGTNMSFIWSGVTEGNWTVMLKDKNNLVDMTGPAKIRWRTRPRSFHVLRPVVKLPDGTMMIGDYGEPGSTYWRETEFFLEDIPRWRAMNPETADMMRGANWKNSIDLSRIDEIGFTDLSRGAGHGAEGNSAVDWIEVYGRPVKR
jgi:hypothetical protein